MGAGFCSESGNRRRRRAGSIAAVLAAVLLSACIGGCRYRSSYRAVGYVHTNTSHKASMSFVSFEGTQSFTLLCGKDGGTLCYSGTLENGQVIVYIDRGDGQKNFLFSVIPGDETASELSGLAGGRIYVIVESEGTCEGGTFVFETD